MLCDKHSVGGFHGSFGSVDNLKSSKNENLLDALHRPEGTMAAAEWVEPGVGKSFSRWKSFRNHFRKLNLAAENEFLHLSCHTNQVATHHRSDPSDDFTRTSRARWQLIWLNDTFHLDLIFPIHNEAVVNAAETSGPVNGMLWQLLHSSSLIWAIIFILSSSK